MVSVLVHVGRGGLECEVSEKFRGKSGMKKGKCITEKRIRGIVEQEL